MSLGVCVCVCEGIEHTSGSEDHLSRQRLFLCGLARDRPGGARSHLMSERNETTEDLQKKDDQQACACKCVFICAH